MNLEVKLDGNYNVKNIIDQIVELFADGFVTNILFSMENRLFIQFSGLLVPENLKQIYDIIQNNVVNSTFEFYKRETEPSSFPIDFVGKVWEDSKDNNEVYRFLSWVNGTYPEHSMTWAYCMISGCVAEVGNKTFEISIGVRGINIPGIIAFDKNGAGVVFIKRKL